MYLHRLEVESKPLSAAAIEPSKDGRTKSGVATPTMLKIARGSGDTIDIKYYVPSTWISG